MTVSTVLSWVALVCGILLVVPGAWGGLPLAAVAIICLALVQTGILARLR